MAYFFLHAVRPYRPLGNTLAVKHPYVASTTVLSGYPAHVSHAVECRKIYVFQWLCNITFRRLSYPRYW